MSDPAGRREDHRRIDEGLRSFLIKYARHEATCSIRRTKLCDCGFEGEYLGLDILINALIHADAEDTARQIADLQVKLKKATNMARHNYQSAVHEQFNAEAHGHEPSPDYPPLVDDEFAAVLTRAEQAEQQIATLRRAFRQVELHLAGGPALPWVASIPPGLWTALLEFQSELVRR